MRDIPDFDQIAHRLASDGSESGIVDAEHIGEIAQQLRQVWNARGAADLEKVKAALVGEGCQPDGPYVTMLESGLRRLDIELVNSGEEGRSSRPDPR